MDHDPNVLPGAGRRPATPDPVIEIDVAGPRDGEGGVGIIGRWVPRGSGSAASGSGRRSDLLARLLETRGGGSPTPFDDLWFGELEPPESLHGAVEAAARLSSAIDEGLRITIHGDYDFDGIAASAILLRVLRRIRPDIRADVVLPDRYESGYGLSVEGLAALRADGTDLVVAVDCGITAHDAIARGNELGLETMVLDHHTIPRDADGGVDLPAASVVVHPHLEVPGSGVGPRERCGAAIAFKVAWALAVQRFGEAGSPEPLKRELLEATMLAGLGTLADVMPLTDENRALAAMALRLLPRTGLPGLRALLSLCGHDDPARPVHEETVQFQLAPRVNALGRLGPATPALELLCDLDDDATGRADVLATAIDSANQRRRDEEKRIVAEAVDRAEAEGQLEPDHPVIVLADPGWRRGLVGPACARLSERFDRPVLLMEASDDGLARGSARSTPGYSIHDGLEACSECLVRFGGHAAAAGFTLESGRVDDLRQALVEHAREALGAARTGVPDLSYDLVASVDDLVDLPGLKRLRSLAPFGQGNPRPVVLLERIEPIGLRWVGATGDTLQIELAGSGRRTLKGVWFRAGEHREAIDAAIGRGRIDIVGSPDIDHWRGRERARFVVADIRPSG